MGYVFVFETSYDVDYGVHFSYVGKEFISKSFAFGRTLDQSCYIDEFYRRVNSAFTVVQTGEIVNSFVFDFNHSHVGFYRTKRIVCRHRLTFRKRVE